MFEADRRTMVTVTVPRRVESIRKAASILVHTARTCGVEAASGPLFEVAIVEALNNALTHNTVAADGTSLAAADASLCCELELSDDTLVIRVLDDGARAPVELVLTGPPSSLPELTPDAWEQVQEGGYGLHLIQAVFPGLRPVTREGRHGIELSLRL